MNLGSSCIYPKLAPQPIREEHLLTGPLEPTNESYAIAKIAAIKLCSSMNRQYRTDFMSLMPNNLYGPGDNYDLEKSHVLPALMRKFHEAKTTGADRVLLWGDGSPLREFLYSDDLADAVVFLMERYTAADAGELLNVGTGEELSIRALAEAVRTVVYEDSPGRICKIEWDSSKPNGTPRKLLDVSRLSDLGWRSRTPLSAGLKAVYRDFLTRSFD
jgi:GDP-L-fucose synthase